MSLQLYPLSAKSGSLDHAVWNACTWNEISSRCADAECQPAKSNSRQGFDWVDPGHCEVLPSYGGVG